MKLERTLETWAALSPDAAKSLSEGAVYWLAADAQRDIATLAEERDRIERNRDMWKGQVDRQARDLEAHAKALADIRRVGDGAYCKALSMFSDTPCLGWEAKVRAGTFGEAEHKAHAEANRLIGFHQGLYEALRIIREASAPAPSSTTGEAA